MKFADIVNMWHTADPASCAEANVMKECVTSPAFMSVVEANYRGCGLTKTAVKQRSLELTNAILKGKLGQANCDTSVHGVACHVVAQLSKTQDSTDPIVGRWQRISREFNDPLNNERLKFLCRVADMEPTLQQIVRTSLTWTLSECNRKGCFVMPYNEP